MKNELFLKFVEFCDNQPKNKRIDHSSWEACTVGDFYKSLNVEIHCANDVRRAAALLNEVAYESKKGTIYYDLNFARLRGIPDNYGDFTLWLKAHPDFNRTAGV